MACAHSCFSCVGQAPPGLPRSRGLRCGIAGEVRPPRHECLGPASCYEHVPGAARRRPGGGRPSCSPTSFSASLRASGPTSGFTPPVLRELRCSMRREGARD